MHPNLYMVQNANLFWKGPFKKLMVLSHLLCLNIGCKCASSLVYLEGGGRKFGPDIRTQLKFEYHAGYYAQNKK